MCAVVEHLGVEDVGAAAEVDDVEHVDVLAQLLLGDLELVDDVVDAQALAAAAGGDEHAGQRDQAGEALGADGAALALAVGRVGDLGDAVGGRAPALAREREVAGVPSDDQVDAVARLALELGRAEQPRVVAEPEHPGHEQARVGVLGGEHDRPVGLARRDLAVMAEVALDVPGHAAVDLDLGGAKRVAELPVRAGGIRARIEVAGALEVVLGLGRVGDLAADAREPEHAQRVALVRLADEVELAALEQQRVGVDLALGDLVAGERVVLEGDRLAAEDRGLDLGQALGEVVPAGAGGQAQRDRALVGGAERVGPAPGDLLQREAQRLGVGELAVEQRQRGLQGRQLGVRELDVGQVELLRAQRVVLLLGGAVGGLVDRERDAQRIELGAVGVEAAGERVLVHARVALDVAPDLRGGDGPPFRHQIGDQRELADELLGVLGHRPATLDSGARGVHGARRYFRSF